MTRPPEPQEAAPVPSIEEQVKQVEASPEYAAWLWLSDRAGSDNDPDDITYAADEMVDAFMAGMAARPQEAAEAVAWRPIDDAAKDGNHYLVCDETSPATPPTVAHWWGAEGEEGFYTSVNEMEPRRPYPATHYSPVPILARQQEAKS